jgi:hypothetical protein
MQVNTSLTDLNLYGNDLGPEGGKAIAKSLEVTFHVSITTKLTFFDLIYFGGVSTSWHVDEQDPD